MYVNVKLLNGFPQTLTYKIPESWDKQDLVGTIITVPIQKRTEQALITRFFDQLPSGTRFTIKEALQKEKFPEDRQYHNFIKKLSNYYAIPPLTLYKRVRGFLAQKEQKTIAQTDVEQKQPVTVILTQEQQVIVDFLHEKIHNPTYTPTLVHGVTGSGKTEIYKEAIKQTLSQNKSTLLLLPEVSLAVRFTHIFRQAFPKLPIYSFHSATSAREKKELWHNLVQGTPLVIIGVHLPTLLPIANLGLIIIDEEHESGYQEKKHPRINTKEAALLRAQQNNIPIVLGSATPSLTSLYNVAHKGWHYFTMTKRYAGSFPDIQVVKINNKIERRNFWITRELEQAIKDRLHKKEQIIIFLNRRGYSFFMQCSECGFIFECPSCSVSLTLHADNSLRCHYCNHQTIPPERCTACTAKKATLLKKGIGTQQVVTILEKLFPNARIARADMDSTVNKKHWEQTVTDFTEKKIDILVGTQTITKGYHFPGVTLVGLLWADINLNIPFYNAAETTLQQIVQVAGRAGRQSPESKVIVQTMVDHPIFNYLNEHDYAKFYTYEVEHRKTLKYPPCNRFAELEIRNTEEHILEAESEHCVKILEQTGDRLTILGPAQPLVHKVKNIFIRKIYLKSDDYQAIMQGYTNLTNHTFSSQIFFTPNPQQ